MTCPRCGGDIEGQQFYGPCAACRAQLRDIGALAKPDPHFVESQRMDGAPTRDFKPCGKKSCSIPACNP